MVGILRPSCALIKIEYTSGSSPDVNGQANCASGSKAPW